MDIAIGTDCQGPARMVRQALHFYERPRRAILLLFRSWRGCIDWRRSWRRGGRNHIDPSWRQCMRRRRRKNWCRGRRTGRSRGRSTGRRWRPRASGLRRHGNGRRRRHGGGRRRGGGWAFHVAMIDPGLLQQVSATFVTAGKRPKPSHPTTVIHFVIPFAVIHVVHETTPAIPAGRRTCRSCGWPWPGGGCWCGS